MQAGPKIVSITEDDPAVREGLQLILERAGYRTIVHDTPRHVLEPAQTIPDIYIVDRQLSGIDGIDVCRHLKAAAATAHIPVIIISATPHVARLAASVHADGFLEKPFRGIELLGLIRECLDK